MVGTQIAVTTKLAATEAIDTQMVMGVNMRTGEIEIAEYDGQIRGQMNLGDFTSQTEEPEDDADPAEEPAPPKTTGRPLDLKRRGQQPQEAEPELVPGRDYDPDTGEVYEPAGRGDLKVVTMARAAKA